MSWLWRSHQSNMKEAWRETSWPRKTKKRSQNGRRSPEPNLQSDIGMEGGRKKKRNTHWTGSSSYEPGNENRLLLMRVRGVMKTAEDMKCFIPTFIQWILASQDEKHTHKNEQRTALVGLHIQTISSETIFCRQFKHEEMSGR